VDSKVKHHSGDREALKPYQNLSNNNSNNQIYIAQVCRLTSEAKCQKSHSRSQFNIVTRSPAQSIITHRQ